MASVTRGRLGSTAAGKRGRGSTAAGKRNSCGKCQDECANGNAVVCSFCELWYHSKCIEGMSAEFVKCCDALNRLYGGSSFLCVVCRKVTAMLNHSMRDMEARMTSIESKLQTAEPEKMVMTEKIKNLESKNRQVNEDVQKIEGEVSSGMEKAKEEVKDEMRDESKARQEIKVNIVIYGLKESEETDVMKRKEDDFSMVKKMAEEIGVELKGDVRIKFRSGRALTGDRPRPLIVTVEDEETRESIMTNAKKMSGKETWKRVFVGPELTWRQREEGRKEEKKLKEDAEKRTEEENGKGKAGKCVVVGRRGRRWLKWVVEARDE